MRVPHRCPVCNGRGHVPNGFYGTTNDEWTTSSLTPDVCKTCNGGGIVWSEDQDFYKQYKTEYDEDIDLP